MRLLTRGTVPALLSYGKIIKSKPFLALKFTIILLVNIMLCGKLYYQEVLDGKCVQMSSLPDVVCLLTVFALI